MLYHPERLAHVHPDLVRLFTRVGDGMDVDVAQGARTEAQEQADIDAGRSHLSKPCNSLHVLDAERPQALAVDGTPHPVNWEDRQSFYDLAAVVKATAEELGLQISWGGDWPHPFDFDHFQLGPAPV